MMSQPTRDQVFISYSHKDHVWLANLQMMLRPLERKKLAIWDDTKIKAGQKWREEIERALAAAKVAVLLVSSHFLGSDFIAEHELPPLLEAAERQGLVILWIYVGSCLYEETEIGKYQAAHDISNPLSRLTAADQDHVLADVCRKIKAAVSASIDRPVQTKSNPTCRHSGNFDIPDRNPFFTGREMVIAQLRRALAAYGRAALSGLGGMGKTQTAAEYCHRYSDDYTYAFWASSHSREALISSYATIANVLKLSESDAKDQAIAVGGVKRWLASNEGWLLILDNADDLVMAREFIPSGKNGDVLLTTRARATGPIARLIEIQEMGTEEGAIFLLRRAKYIAEDAPLNAADEVDQGEAKSIATQLDGLPLALDQAAAYIEETGCGLRDYINLYRHHAPALLRYRGTLSSNYAYPVASTWILSFDNIQKANAASAELLLFCSFLHPDAIHEELLRKGASELGPVLGPVVSDAFALNSSISEILKYSLLRRNADTDTLEIHRLVQAALKDGMEPDAQRLWAERAVRAVNCAFPKVEFSTWPDCERYFPQAQACAELIQKWDLQFAEAGQLLDKARLYLFARAQYTEAEPLYKQVLALREKALGPEHPEVGKCLNFLAVLYGRQGRSVEAEPLYKRALAIQENALGPEHPDVAWSLNPLGALYGRQGRYAEAELLHKRALAIREKVLGAEHPEVAWSLHDLAALYSRQGQYAKAEPLHQRALAIREKKLGPEHPQVASSLDGLAVLFDRQGRYAEAELLYKRALIIQENALGPEHLDVSWSLNPLGALYDRQTRYAEAEPLLNRALRIREKALGTDHPDVAWSLNYLAVHYGHLERYKEAESLCRRGLEIREKALGSNHPDVAMSLNSLAVLHYLQGENPETEPLLKRALAIRERTLGPNHPDVAESFQCLAVLYGRSRSSAEAEQLFKRALALWEKVLGLEHPNVAICLEEYAFLLQAAGRPEEAEPLKARAEEIRRKMLNPTCET
jgi:hypothetical protein